MWPTESQAVIELYFKSFLSCFSLIEKESTKTFKAETKAEIEAGTEPETKTSVELDIEPELEIEPEIESDPKTDEEA